ncbi:riboflavin biosynthesis protein RibF [Oceanidesulfovibrio indonesiensis]|uniref:Riboflavin biosynthesis protein n=1 Tax=Oceanidesulfovibrio indonesiensis TaxID=54767 RepID=A0A7M3MCH5_9BACT|nr:bifunctional riboflavin kinase/FAD synthetase [Oceanidesulfovibrio indonesiensis]TVM15560.1 riboflavin biosynthesis protein RibF [Oceanidesulfovibrio indonesiensis]
MEIARRKQEISLDLSGGSAATIGNFDGVHKGHARLIERVLAKARTRSLASVVVTFCPHPLQVLVGPHTPPFITVRDQKLDLIEDLGVDLTMLLEFNREMASLSPRDFVHKYLVDWLNVKELVVGYDYTFGKGRQGNFAMLTELGREFGFNVERLDPVIINDAIVSSTRIRDHIKAGEVFAVRPLLGRFYVVRGKVVSGESRGRLLGFPTANLTLENEVSPKNGVYAVWAQLNGRLLPAVANLGYKPTFEGKKLSFEVHILDFAEDIYGHELRVHFVQFIRPEQKFSGPDELIARIREDAALARRILAAPEAQL